MIVPIHRRPRDASGGAVSLWVVIMVPILALAGVAAIAVPQRMAAEVTVADAAEDLATLAVAWREGSGVERRTLDAFPPDCSSAVGSVWEARCRELWEPILIDLGGAGVDVESLAGYYSDSYVTSEIVDDRPPCRVFGSNLVLDAAHVALVADWYGGWAGSQIWPDGVRMGTEAVGHLNVAFIDDSHHVDYGAGGQWFPDVYPSGGTTNAVPAEVRGNECGERLDLANAYGEPGWLRDPGFAGRRMAESVSFRTPFGSLRDPIGETLP